MSSLLALTPAGMISSSDESPYPAGSLPHCLLCSRFCLTAVVSFGICEEEPKIFCAWMSWASLVEGGKCIAAERHVACSLWSAGNASLVVRVVFLLSFASNEGVLFLPGAKDAVLHAPRRRRTVSTTPCSRHSKVGNSNLHLG